MKQSMQRDTSGSRVSAACLLLFVGRCVWVRQRERERSICVRVSVGVRVCVRERECLCVTSALE